MSVRLTPICPDSEESEIINICNGTWQAITVATKAYGENVEVWNGRHDAQVYTPDKLRRMADRIEQLQDAPEWLRWLAEQGGAKLS